ncbi:hypothetical protein FACUT_9312 [Fusarium acutatum]|uniref:hydroxyacylglutathione hydrolase n=1 Tax=Fusarium acutatum TaxID=78861 RepID=A0A8H4JIF5_9HYPO|nr:hypothetical protein FACUT_9312 [Fusarium acutatum]
MFIQPIPMWWGSNDNWAYLVVDDETRDALIVDPANPEEVVPILIAAIQSNKLNLVAIINTHHHWDHAGGNEEILVALNNPKLDIIGGKDCEGVTKTPSHGETFKLGNITITSIHTPCHTQDSICFFFQDREQKVVFTGDTLFTGGCGRFFEGTAEEMHVALNKHLASLPDDTVVFPGHEYTRSNAKFAISVLQSEPVQQLLGFSAANPVTVGKYTIGHEKVARKSCGRPDGSQTKSSRKCWKQIEEAEQYPSPHHWSDYYHIDIPSTPTSPTFTPMSPSYWWPDEADDSLPHWTDHMDEMTLLPDPRPRALTPLGFQDECASETIERPVPLYQKSPWFKLPPNIRRDILRLAFGDHRLHMSLTFRQKYTSDEEKVESWQWFGGICHRGKTPRPRDIAGGQQRFWEDDCKHGDFEPRNTGVLSWLLSCRQNYAEMIDLLYSSNTIAMSGEAMISHIGQLMLPPRLAAVTSLEIRWPLQRENEACAGHHDEHTNAIRRMLHPYQLDVDQLSVVLDTLSNTSFPNLRRLCISFEKEYNERHISNPEVHDIIVNKLLQFVTSRPKFKECAFALPEKVFRTIIKDVRTMDPDSREPPSPRSCKQVWCGSDGNMHAMHAPFVNTYPAPPPYLDNREDSGFWLLRID